MGLTYLIPYNTIKTLRNRSAVLLCENLEGEGTFQHRWNFCKVSLVPQFLGHFFRCVSDFRNQLQNTMFSLTIRIFDEVIENDGNYY